MGIKIKKIKHLINKFEYFFSEDQGRYIAEISKNNIKQVVNLLNKNSIHYDELGILTEKDIIIDEKTIVSVEKIKEHHESWLKNYMTQ